MPISSSWSTMRSSRLPSASRVWGPSKYSRVSTKKARRRRTVGKLALAGYSGIEKSRKVLYNKEARVLGRWMSKTANPLAMSGTVETQAGSGIPPFVKTKQLYWDRIQLGDGTLAPYSHVFRLNSTFDPDESGIGHQPKGRDFYASIYNSYIVTGCKYDLQFVSQGTTRFLVGALVSTDAALGTTFDTQTEIMETKSRFCKKRILDGTDQNTTREVCRITGYVPMSKFALSGYGSLDEQFSTGVAANPVTPVRLHVWCIDEGGDPVPNNNVACRVMLTYYVTYKGVVGATSS